MRPSAQPSSPPEKPRASSELPIYDAAQLYDIAFSYRDFREETDVLLAWYRRAAGAERPRRVIELASGPCDHALELSARGIAAAGLDLSSSMCAYAEGKARGRGLPLEVHCGDMISFDLDRRFDLALLMLNSIAHIYTLGAMVQHLETVARHLNDRGVYVLEVQHPNNFLGRGRRPPGLGVSQPWRVHRDDIDLEITWGTEDDPYDPIAQTFQARVELRAVRPGGQEQVLVDRCVMRDWTRTELEAAVTLSGAFEIAELHGSFAPDAPFDNSPESWRMILVLRKK